MNGGYGFQPNFTVRALLPAPPGMKRLALVNSSPERRAQCRYGSSKARLSKVGRLPSLQSVQIPSMLCLFKARIWDPRPGQALLPAGLARPGSRRLRGDTGEREGDP